MKKELQTPPRPWWKFGHVWLVISGPAAVAVAGAITVWLAVVYQDPLVTDDHYRRGRDASQSAAAVRDKSLAPAQQGRNHAATPLPGPAR